MNEIGADVMDGKAREAEHEKRMRELKTRELFKFLKIDISKLLKQ